MKAEKIKTNQQLKNKIFKCEHLDIWNKKNNPYVLMQVETAKGEQIQIEFNKYQLIDELSHIEYMKALIFVKDLLNKNKNYNFEPESIDISLIGNLMYIIKKGHRCNNDQEYINDLEDAAQLIFDSIE